MVVGDGEYDSGKVMMVVADGSIRAPELMAAAATGGCVSSARVSTRPVQICSGFCSHGSTRVQFRLSGAGLTWVNGQ
ncbi:hypothetical protein HanPI659440_Chr04g0149351 [Helianthus annuus]|nr:hypothetical protein HanPI659440_Chr04g0149351 [Helianthus annuus]